MFYPQCPKCEYEGPERYSLVDPAIVRCPQCDHIYSYIWCETCGIGGDFINNIDDRPRRWVCTDCGSSQSIPCKAYAVIEGVNAIHVEDTKEEDSPPHVPYSGETEVNINSPYRRPVYFSFIIFAVLALASGIFVDNIKLSILVMSLALAGAFSCNVVMGYKSGILPTKTGDLIIRKREPVYFYISYTFTVLAAVFLFALSLIIIYSDT